MENKQRQMKRLKWPQILPMRLSSSSPLICRVQLKIRIAPCMQSSSSQPIRKHSRKHLKASTRKPLTTLKYLRKRKKTKELLPPLTDLLIKEARNKQVISHLMLDTRYMLVLEVPNFPEVKNNALQLLVLSSVNQRSFSSMKQPVLLTKTVRRRYKMHSMAL